MLGRVAAEHCIPLLTRYTVHRIHRAKALCSHFPGEHFTYSPTPHAPSTLEQVDRNMLKVAFLGWYVGAQALQHRWQRDYGNME